MTSRTGTLPSELTSTSGLSCEVLTTHSAALTSVDRLFGSGINATIFHHPRFLSYHSADKFPHAEWRHYLFSLKGNPVAFLPGAAVNEEQLTYRNPLGSTHGGLVYGALSFAKHSYGASIGDIQDRLDRNCQILGAIEASTRYLILQHAAPRHESNAATVNDCRHIFQNAVMRSVEHER